MKRLWVLSDAFLCSGDTHTCLASFSFLVFLHISRFVCDNEVIWALVKDGKHFPFNQRALTVCHLWLVLLQVSLLSHEGLKGLLLISV